jgi:hypothetical protein
MKNWEVFLEDPRKRTLPNDGVARVGRPTTKEEWEVLRYELETFVCSGEYEGGLEKILKSFLTNLSQPTQPDVWASGFYGSGKSHLVKVLEHLWIDTRFPDGSTARGLVKLPAEISNSLRELNTEGSRSGGLWATAGTLGSGTREAPRLAFLGIVFNGSGLPTAFNQASFVLWLKEEGVYEEFVAALAAEDNRELRWHLHNLYASPYLRRALLEAYPDFAAAEAEVAALLEAQFPQRNEDVTREEMLFTLERVLRLQSRTPGKLPLTLIVLDELQQNIGADIHRAEQVQEIVEAVSGKFESAVLIVGTGQSALIADRVLARLLGRFTVHVHLSDTDIENVVREVALRKDPTKAAALDQVLDQAAPEIARELQGTSIAAKAADQKYVAADYPILPTRQRFWEIFLRNVDRGGAGQLRSQLRVSVEAAKAVAEQPLGHAVPADFIYRQQRGAMLENGVLGRELDQRIEEQDNGSPDGDLRRRICGLIFCISRIPSDAETGLRPTSDFIADLMVDDLINGGATTRSLIPEQLATLIDEKVLMKVEDEYRLQTREGAEWERAFSELEGKIRGDAIRIEDERSQRLRQAVEQHLGTPQIAQGKSKTSRKADVQITDNEPQDDQAKIPVWVRDGWTTSESTVKKDAQAGGPMSSRVYVFLPKIDPEAVTKQIANLVAAGEVLDAKPGAETDEAREARSAMVSRCDAAQEALDGHFDTVLDNAKVYLGGGTEVTEGGGLKARVLKAMESAAARLYDKFPDGDAANWSLVATRASQGNADALSAIGYTGEVEKHPVTRAILDFIGAGGKKGSEILQNFLAAPYGWPKDGINACVLVLVAAGLARASENGIDKTIKELNASAVAKTTFARQTVTLSTSDKIAVRKLCQDMGVQCPAGEENRAIREALQRLLSLAEAAGGEPPLPQRPPTTVVQEILDLEGNDRLAESLKHADDLRSWSSEWAALATKASERQKAWGILERLLAHASDIDGIADVASRAEAVAQNRLLLVDPDQVAPLTNELTTKLRAELKGLHDRLASATSSGISSLEGDPNWGSIENEKRQGLLDRHGLNAPAEPELGSTQAVLRALQSASLAARRSEVDAVPSRTNEARIEAAQLLTPKARPLTLPKRTLQSPTDVGGYVKEVNDLLVAAIENGPIVVS